MSYEVGHGLAGGTRCLNAQTKVGVLVFIPSLTISQRGLLWAVARADWYLEGPFWPQSG